MRIGKRLEKLLSLLDKNLGAVADIGTDHGFLAVRAVIDKNAKKVYATDISAESLSKAADLSVRMGLSGQIECVVSDGFDRLNERLDAAVIAGMGGHEIVKILGRVDPFQVKTYLLQPMQDVEVLREWLLLNGFEIVYDETVMDRGKFYSAIKCVYSGVKKECEIKDIIFGKTDLENKGQDFIEYLQFNIQSLQARKNHLNSFDQKKLELMSNLVLGK